MVDYIRREVEFRAKVPETSTCTCAACHNVGRVVKLELPRTLYREGILQTEYSEYWLCLNCREAMVQALVWPDAEEWQEVPTMFQIELLSGGVFWVYAVDTAENMFLIYRDDQWTWIGMEKCKPYYPPAESYLKKQFISTIEEGGKTV